MSKPQIPPLDDSELGFLVSDLRQALFAASAATLHHVRRTANVVAHLLAKNASSHRSGFLFYTAAPPFVEDALSNDCNA